MESSDDAVISKDLNGIILSWNKGAERLFGYSPQEAVGQPVTMLIPPDRFNEEPEILNRIRRGESIEHYDTVRHRKDGTLLDISLTVSPIRNEQGQIVGASKIARDVTERRQIELEKAKLLKSEHEARNQAETANRVKDEFLAVVSHELRTPLNAILGWAQILRRGTLDNEAVNRGLETIERNARAQNQLISDLLDVSRVISGRLHCEMGAVELIPVIDAAAETVRPSADAKGIELRLSLDPKAGLIAGDAIRLQQIIWNLIANAVKFTPRTGRVDIQLKRQDTSVVIIVSDTGEGISPEFLPYIFDRFRQAEGGSSRQHGGLGLGLAIVRHLVELHGGSVRAASEGAGKGATFTASFPLIAVTRMADPGMPKDGIVQSGPKSKILAGIRVLVVDDERDARDLVTLALAQSGAEVRTSTTVREALETLAQWRPDVLVSDIGMPQEDGYALIRKLRALESEFGGAIPSIALTGYAGEEDAARARLAGYQLHLPKPVSPSELVFKVASLITQGA